MFKTFGIVFGQSERSVKSNIEKAKASRMDDSDVRIHGTDRIKEDHTADCMNEEMEKMECEIHSGFKNRTTDEKGEGKQRRLQKQQPKT